ncbi:uncharacterized protein LOC131006870 [Salvia miltiorrhiza]|nr:uncharacterized protein LOC131006870 [Salvia miltiorrhiza]
MRFYRCPLQEADSCSYFEFIDPRPTELQRNFIAKLKRERDQLQDELRRKTCECLDLKEAEENAETYIVEHHEMGEEIVKLKEELTKLKRKCWLRGAVIGLLLGVLVVVHV